MHQSAKKLPPQDESSFTLKLRRASVDTAESVDQSPADLMPLVIDRDGVRVSPGFELPHRCVCCGDSMNTLASRTLRGNIRYRLCREHAVSVVAKASMGALVAALSVICIASKLIGDPILNNGGTWVCCLLGLAGAGLVYWTLPIKTLKLIDGAHRVTGLHADVIADLQRSQQ